MGPARSAPLPSGIHKSIPPRHAMGPASYVSAGCYYSAATRFVLCCVCVCVAFGSASRPHGSPIPPRGRFLPPPPPPSPKVIKTRRWRKAANNKSEQPAPRTQSPGWPGFADPEEGERERALQSPSPLEAHHPFSSSLPTGKGKGRFAGDQWGGSISITRGSSLHKKFQPWAETSIARCHNTPPLLSSTPPSTAIYKGGLSFLPPPPRLLRGEKK